VRIVAQPLGHVLLATLEPILDRPPALARPAGVHPAGAVFVSCT